MRLPPCGVLRRRRVQDIRWNRGGSGGSRSNSSSSSSSISSSSSSSSSSSASGGSSSGPDPIVVAQASLPPSEPLERLGHGVRGGRHSGSRRRLFPGVVVVVVRDPPRRRRRRRRPRLLFLLPPAVAVIIILRDSPRSIRRAAGLVVVCLPERTVREHALSGGSTATTLPTWGSPERDGRWKQFKLHLLHPIAATAAVAPAVGPHDGGRWLLLGATAADVGFPSAARVVVVVIVVVDDDDVVAAAVEVDHALLGVSAAELPLPAAVHAERRELAAARVGARVRPKVDHPVQGMPSAELGLLLLVAVGAVVEAVARSGAAARGQARLLLSTNVDHVGRSMPEAELRFVGAGHAKVWLSVTHGVATPPVGRSQQAPQAPLGGSADTDVRVHAAAAAAAAATATAVDTATATAATATASSDAAAAATSGADAAAFGIRNRPVRLGADGVRVEAATGLVPVPGVHHARFGMPGAELCRPAAGDPEARLLGATQPAAPPAPDVDHAVAGVPRAEHRLLAAVEAVRRDDGAALPAADLGPDVHHAGLGVPGAELRLLATARAVSRVRGAARVAARLAAHVHHVRPGVPRARLRFLGAEHAEPGLGRAAGLVA